MSEELWPKLRWPSELGVVAGVPFIVSKGRFPPVAGESAKDGGETGGREGGT